jgi:hypothetical protein
MQMIQSNLTSLFGQTCTYDARNVFESLELARWGYFQMMLKLMGIAGRLSSWGGGCACHPLPAEVTHGRFRRSVAFKREVETSSGFRQECPMKGIR